MGLQQQTRVRAADKREAVSLMSTSILKVLLIVLHTFGCTRAKQKDNFLQTAKPITKY